MVQAIDDPAWEQEYLYRHDGIRCKHVFLFWWFIRGQLAKFRVQNAYSLLSSISDIFLLKNAYLFDQHWLTAFGLIMGCGFIFPLVNILYEKTIHKDYIFVK